MSAGTGVEHSEYNHEPEKCHLLQVWLFPKERGIQPSYEQKSFADKLASQELTLVVSPNGAQDSIKIHQDARIYQGRVAAGKSLLLPTENTRNYWIQVVRGAAEIGGQSLKTGDGLAISQEGPLRWMSKENSEFLLFDLP